MVQKQFETVKLAENEKEKNIVVRTYMGRPSKLHESQMNTLRNCVENKKVCTVHEIQEYIVDEFNVKYSSKEVREILRKFHLNYYPLLRKYTYPSYYDEKIIKKFDF
ncbi:helix-turn-helix domain-containing protein [Ferroplasma sp.]|uniref:helix-turn-helix domain-containing protein n=1 Tax=Ferroplasma sp. TaxID=2591003 RepID=UPI00307D17D2